MCVERLDNDRISIEVYFGPSMFREHFRTTGRTTSRNICKHVLCGHWKQKRSSFQCFRDEQLRVSHAPLLRFGGSERSCGPPAPHCLFRGLAPVPPWSSSPVRRRAFFSHAEAPPASAREEALSPRGAPGPWGRADRAWAPRGGRIRRLDRATKPATR